MCADHAAVVSNCRKNLMPTFASYYVAVVVTGMMEVSERRLRITPRSTPA